MKTEIDLGPVSEAELNAFRSYFQIEVLQDKWPPILGAREGAPDDGSSLYLTHYKYLLEAMSSCFQLSVQDLDIQTYDHQTTAGIGS